MITRAKIAVVSIFSFIACSAFAISDAQAARKWTVTQRQVALRKKVETGLKSNELTAKEARKLNDALDDIQESVEKMKSKNAGQLSYKDEGKIEKKLNSVSLNIDKYQLQKRVVAR